MYIKMMYIYLRMYFNIKWQSSTMQNHNYFCTNLILYLTRCFIENIHKNIQLTLLSTGRTLKIYITFSCYYKNITRKSIRNQFIVPLSCECNDLTLCLSLLNKWRLPLLLIYISTEPSINIK